MASTDARPTPHKNVAYRHTFPIFDASGSLVTGAAGLDSEVSKDSGTFTDCTNEATEIATSSGMYYLDLTATEMNADCVVVIVKTSTVGAKTTPIVLYPEEAGDIRVTVTQMNVPVSVESYATTTAYPLQPTVAGRTLDVAATGEAGLDFDNINQASSATTLQLITVPVVGQLNNAVGVSSLDPSIYTNLLGQHYLYGASFNTPVVTADTVTLNGETGANDNCIVGCIFLVRDSTGLLKLVRRVKAYDFATNTVTVDEPWGVNVPLDNDRWEVRAFPLVLNEAVNAYSAKELWRIIGAVLAGKSTGAMAGVGTIVFRDTADTKDVVTSGFDADGNRTSVTVDPS